METKLQVKEEIPSVFALIKQGNYEEVGDLLLNNDINVNVVDGVGNDVLSRLLKAKQYELVLEIRRRR